ncbi:DUF742 domain-containing protein [Streptacidiphilus sp. MAP5-3]|uniref:DUF742 domain-containing protein n=1 Tax=unclassified Streptacidiphilus TaxID=2643834 RepID=UPI003516C821
MPGEQRDGHDKHDGQDAHDVWDEDDDDDWDDLSQLVRPYTLTRGRTRHSGSEAFDVVTQISAVPREPGIADEDAQDPEHEAILDLVRHGPLSVAELASDLDLPLGVVRILLGDLLAAELIQVTRPVPLAELPDVQILREVIQGLRAL